MLYDTEIWSKYDEDERIKCYVEDIIEEFECDYETAIDLLSHEISAVDYSFDRCLNDRNLGDLWVLQKAQGCIAHELGFEFMCSEDEQGTVYFCVSTSELFSKMKLAYEPSHDYEAFEETI